MDPLSDRILTLFVVGIMYILLIILFSFLRYRFSQDLLCDGSFDGKSWMEVTSEDLNGTCAHSNVSIDVLQSQNTGKIL